MDAAQKCYINPFGNVMNRIAWDLEKKKATGYFHGRTFHRSQLLFQRLFKQQSMRYFDCFGGQERIIGKNITFDVRVTK